VPVATLAAVPQVSAAGRCCCIKTSAAIENAAGGALLPVASNEDSGDLAGWAVLRNNTPS